MKFFIDQMAKYKYNVSQLHLTDDQGWRVAIHSHPRLASAADDSLLRPHIGCANDYLFPYPEDVTLVTWRYRLTPTCLTLTHQHGHPIIMAPGEYAYLDYPQWRNDFPEFNNWGMPLSTLENCYKLDPGYGRLAEEQAHVLGVMGTLWAEAIPDINRATYMAFPRALALAEAGWTEMPRRSWESFKEPSSPPSMI